MELRLYQVDAFAERLFGGNPAAVCPLDSWLPDETMQKIAAENNLAETAFYVRTDGGFHIRWFTPTVEVDLCGHATLASAYVVFTHDRHAGDVVEFASKSGPLKVKREAELLVLDFPADPVEPVTVPQMLMEALGREPIETYKGKTDYLVVYGAEEHVAALTPDLCDLADGARARHHRHGPRTTGRFRVAVLRAAGGGSRGPGDGFGPHDADTLLVGPAGQAGTDGHAAVQAAGQVAVPAGRKPGGDCGPGRAVHGGDDHNLNNLAIWRSADRAIWGCGGVAGRTPPADSATSAITMRKSAPIKLVP